MNMALKNSVLINWPGQIVDRLVLGPDTRMPILRQVDAPVTSMSVRSRVSVVIPCHNYGRFLSECVQSVLDQQGVDVEVIIVDDASTDESRAVATRFASHDDRVRVVQHDTNTGFVAAFNDGLKYAEGDFIVRLDADDLLTAGSLARSAGLLQAFPSVGLVYGHPLHFTSDVPTHFETLVDSWTVWSGDVWLSARCQQAVNCITSPEAVIRASVLESIGPLRGELSVAPDMEMWLRAAAVSDVGRVNGPDQAFHRDHSASLTAAADYDVLGDLVERQAVFEVFFSDPNLRLPNRDLLREAASRTLARHGLDRACREFDRGTRDLAAVDQYVAFAFGVYPRATMLEEWAELRRRISVGARWSRWVPSFFFHAVVRRMREKRWYARWERTGV